MSLKWSGTKVIPGLQPPSPVVINCKVWLDLEDNPWQSMPNNLQVKNALVIIIYELDRFVITQGFWFTVIKILLRPLMRFSSQKVSLVHLKLLLLKWLISFLLHPAQIITITADIYGVHIYNPSPPKSVWSSILWPFCLILAMEPRYVLILSLTAVSLAHRVVLCDTHLIQEIALCVVRHWMSVQILTESTLHCYCMLMAVLSSAKLFSSPEVTVLVILVSLSKLKVHWRVLLGSFQQICWG